jgi:hypothetical protein
MTATDLLITKQEFDTISEYIFVSLQNAELTEDTLLLKEYATFLKKILRSHTTLSAKNKADIIHFLAKINTKNEQVDLQNNPQKSLEIARAAQSFAKKTRLNG